MTELQNIQAKYTALTFQNKGYEKLPKQVREENADIIKHIESLLTERISGFVEFNNFKVRPNGSVVARVQHMWDTSFVGVGYFDLEELK